VSGLDGVVALGFRRAQPRPDQDAQQAPSFRSGKDSADSKAVVNVNQGVFCCSMYWRTMLMGAPPQEEAK